MAEVKNAWSYTPTPQYFVMAWWLVKHRDNFILPYFTYRRLFSGENSTATAFTDV